MAVENDFNGFGIFVRSYPTGGWQGDDAANIPIDAVRHDQHDSDFAIALSKMICKDGQSVIAADIPWNGKRIINLGDPRTGTSGAQDAVTRHYAETVLPGWTTAKYISGADAQGRLNFTAATGVNGITWTAADLSWLAKTGPNRLVLNNNAAGTGTDVVSIFDDGKATFTGAVTVASLNATSGILSTPNGRIISQSTAAGGLPSVSCWSTARSSNVGFWNDASSQMSFGNLDGNGAPAATWGWWNATGGLTVQVGNIQTTGEMYAGKNITTGMGVGSVGPINAGTSLSAVSGAMFIGTGGVSGNSRIMQFAPNYYWNWYPSGGHLAYMIGAAQQVLFNTSTGTFLSVGGGHLTIGGNATKPGGGSWTAASDLRLKNLHGAYEHGLAEVLQLNPVRYAYKTKPEVEYVGLVAQDIEALLPETVSLAEGEIDGQKVQDIRQLDPSALLYAAINAIKELSAKLGEAQARIAALEAA